MEHASKIAILLALVIIVGLPLVLRREGETAATTGASERLVIMSPHNEQIRFEFSRGFNRWRAAQALPLVEFDWRTSGGTSDLRRQIFAEFEALARDRRENEGNGVDIFFGGGEYEHNKLARGIEVKRDEQTPRISLSIATPLPEERLKAIFPSPTIGSALLYHPDRNWFGTALSSFGIVYNNEVLDMLGVDEPTHWRDLGEPRLFRLVALADPSHSGSITATYEVILKRHGWTEGWAMLRRGFANSRYFANSSSRVPVEVSVGEAAAGMCIDFYGRTQAGAVAVPGEPSRVDYVDPVAHIGPDNPPVSITATTSDPISILRGAPSVRAAEARGQTIRESTAYEFVAWTLTKDAQRLWQRRLDAPDGPVQFELRRLPVRRDLYNAEEIGYWVDQDVDPFGQAQPLPEAMPGFYGLVATVAHAIAIDVHDDLQAAWQTLNATPDDDPRKAKMLELFDAMPPELTLTWPDAQLAAQWHEAIADPTHPRHEEAATHLDSFVDGLYARWENDDQDLRDRLAWMRFFRKNYQAVVAMRK